MVSNGHHPQARPRLRRSAAPSPATCQTVLIGNRGESTWMAACPTAATASCAGGQRYQRRGSGFGGERVEGGREPVATPAHGLDVLDRPEGGLPGPAVDDLGRSRAGGVWAGDAVGHRSLAREPRDKRSVADGSGVGCFNPGRRAMAAASAAGMCSETAVRRRNRDRRNHQRAFPQLNTVKWAWLDLNQHPHQRCAIRSFRSSR